MGKVIETVADSIAIEILDKNTILTGKGNELHLFRKNVNKENNVFETQVLDIKLTNKIHGIKKKQNACDNILLVYGEKEFALLTFNDKWEFKEFYRTELSDWISCGLWLDDPQEVVLLTAHSIILRFSYNVIDQKCMLKERVSCTDKSTLYCAHLLGKNWNDLVVFAGNAFGELLIWQPIENEENKGELKKPKVSPLLHRVAAHNGVIFSIDYDVKSQCLITTSDDRAIKWWQVQFKCNNNWSQSLLQPLASGYGHVARVFQGRIINDGSNIYALSVGEDSYFCLWHKNGQLLFKRRQQYGATIWNFIYDNNTQTIYTVGSIGNLVAFGLKQVLHESNETQNETLQPPALTDKNSSEYVAKVKFLNEKHLIAITNQNNLVTSRLKGDEWLNWENVPIQVDFKCTVLEIYENLIAICGYKRMILLEYNESREEFLVKHNEQLLKSVIRTFVFFSPQQYLACDDQGNCMVFMDSKNNIRYLELPKCKEPWLTTALLLNKQQFMVVSNRQGNFLLYQLKSESCRYELKQIIKHPHGNLGATNLQCLEENSTMALIRSSGHDGAINVFSIDFVNAAFQICYRHVIPVSWVEHVEKWYNNLDIFLGFNDNHFVVWSKEYDFLLQLPCGGGHRCWHFIIDTQNYKISLAFIKNKKVHFHKLPLLNQELISLPMAKKWHIAPCNVMVILTQTHSTPPIAITAGDDNIIKIHTFNVKNGLTEKMELHHHISNIRALKVLSMNKTEFLIFSGGGRAQLCVTKVNLINFHINELINYTLKQDNDKKLPNKSYNFDPETRLMSLDVKAVNGSEYEIYVGCSDGFIRHLHINLKTFEITLLSQFYYGRCILQLSYIKECDYVLVAATDGLLTFYDRILKKSLHQLQHHSSGVNGLATLYEEQHQCLHILTGGDDQAVAYTKLYINDKEEFKVLNNFHKPFLHTAQVCACALSSNGLYGFTSGVDQVLNKLDLSTGEVVDSFYSCVADIKGVALVEDDICLLYGCGLQIYTFDS
ncbi:tRNA (34-2'-O)-methyltransferase regulator WDR6 [Cochliomyia hominivorax]